jgi:hypothetical protein
MLNTYVYFTLGSRYVMDLHLTEQSLTSCNLRGEPCNTRMYLKKIERGLEVLMLGRSHFRNEISNTRSPELEDILKEVNLQIRSLEYYLTPTAG